MAKEISYQLADKLVEIAQQLVAISEQIREEIEFDITPEVQKRFDTHESEGICLSCESSLSGEKSIKRGCHNHCYIRMNRHIREGKANERELVEGGQMRTPEPGGRKLKNPPPAEERGTTELMKRGDVHSERTKPVNRKSRKHAIRNKPAK